MALLEWNDSYSVGVATIDRQHAGLFGMLNDLHTAMMKGQTKLVIGPLLDKLVKYTRVHFAYEEKAMEASKYPNLSTHRIRHRELTKQADDFAARYKKGDASLNIELIRFLSDWLTKHIMHEDKLYSDCMKQSGVK